MKHREINLSVVQKCSIRQFLFMNIIYVVRKHLQNVTLLLFVLVTNVSNLFLSLNFYQRCFSFLSVSIKGLMRM
jgi:hypothetical protein